MLHKSTGRCGKNKKPLRLCGEFFFCLGPPFQEKNGAT